MLPWMQGVLSLMQAPPIQLLAQHPYAQWTPQNKANWYNCTQIPWANHSSNAWWCCSTQLPYELDGRACEQIGHQVGMERRFKPPRYWPSNKRLYPRAFGKPLKLGKSVVSMKCAPNANQTIRIFTKKHSKDKEVRQSGHVSSRTC